MKIFYFIQFIMCIMIMIYDCSIESKYTLCWAVGAVIYFIAFKTEDLADYFDNKLAEKETKN